MLSKILNIACVLGIITVICICANAAEARPVVRGLISYWTFDKADDGDDEDDIDIERRIVKDVWGENDGTIMGDPEGEPQIVEGRVGDAMVFREQEAGDGNHYVDCGNDERLDFERTDAFSLQAWVKKESDIAGLGQVVFAKTSFSGNYRGWLLWFRSTGALDFLIRSDWPSKNLIGVKTQELFPKPEWHHIVATYDGSSKASGAKIYVDGVNVPLKISYDALSGTIKTDLIVKIGARDDGKNLFNGTIDEVCIYGRALSEDEVRRNYESETNDLAVSAAGKLGEAWGKIKLGSRR